MTESGQNEPCHSLRRHGRSTSVSGPAGLAVGTSGSGQERTPAAQRPPAMSRFPRSLNRDRFTRNKRGGSPMRRREFIARLGGAVAAWPLATRAQQPVLRLVGWLGVGASPDDARETITGVKQGLAQAGFVEGRNYTFEYRFADYDLERLPI